MSSSDELASRELFAIRRPGVLAPFVSFFDKKKLLKIILYFKIKTLHQPQNINCGKNGENDKYNYYDGTPDEEAAISFPIRLRTICAFEPRILLVY